MCGINGIVHFDRLNLVPREFLKHMNDAIRHRGPDDDGYYIDRNVGLGMRRLSIIDVQGGHQPIPNENKSIWVICNGEIYNYKELRDGLEKRGHLFLTDSDTEVIAHQYEEDGDDFILKLNGMFGLALWDSKNRKLIIARDRLGIKPLYYYVDDEKLVFSSEPKAILQYPGIKPEMDFQALWDFLTFRYVPAPRSMFKNINKMHPGFYGVLENNHFRIKQYWDIPTNWYTEEKSNEGPGKEEYIRLFEEQFMKSVSSHLMSDVPLGVLLSGGLDSSSVVCAMKRLGVERVETFSVGFKGGFEFNELSYAREVAGYFKTDHYEILINSNEFLDGLNKCVYYSDEPLADLASIPLWYVSKLASERVKVVLSGEGSDEILAGYSGFETIMRRAKLIEGYQRLPSFMKSFIGKCSGMLYVPEKAKKIHHSLNIRLEEFGLHYPINMTNFFREEEKRELFDVRTNEFQESYGIIKNLYHTQKGKRPLDQILYVYCKSWLPDDLLTKADRMTMANSIELRVPFLDHNMVETAFRMPDELKISFFARVFSPKRKMVLRHIMKNGLPNSVIKRVKYGFPTPANRWVRNELKDFVRDILYSSGSFIRNNCNISKLDELVKKSELKDELTLSKIWLLVVLSIWNKTFMVSSKIV